MQVCMYSALWHSPMCISVKEIVNAFEVCKNPKISEYPRYRMV